MRMVPFYIWQLPVRVFHWLNAVCVIALFATGLYIGAPLVRSGGEAYESLLMGWVRYVHVAAGYVFGVNLLVRVYWFLRGNVYSRMIFLPWKRKEWAEAARVGAGYLTASPEAEDGIGPNALARLTYTLYFVVAAVICFTGLAMHGGVDTTGRLAGATRWVVSLFGGERPLHSWHHLLGYGVALFVLAHVYIVIRTDVLTRRGLAASMFKGSIYVREDEAAALAHSGEARER